jgi:hypothetical protein
MKTIVYRLNGKENLYDFNTIINIVKHQRSKLQRKLKKISGTDIVRYKNQNLYKEEVLFLLMEETLFQELDKIEEMKNELPKSQTN